MSQELKCDTFGWMVALAGGHSSLEAPFICLESGEVEDRATQTCHGESISPA